MAKSFTSGHSVNSALYEEHELVPWKEGTKPAVRVIFFAPGGPGVNGRASGYTFAAMKFDTGSSMTFLDAQKVKDLGLDTTWKDPAELRYAQCATGSYILGIAREAEVAFGNRKAVPIEVCVPINSPDPVRDQELWRDASEWFKRQVGGQALRARIVRAPLRNLLGLKAVCDHYLACVSDEGLYLFKKRLDPPAHIILRLMAWAVGALKCPLQRMARFSSRGQRCPR
jgi:hypothetical protein